MVVIRLSRGGTNKRPFYTVVVADRREARDGRVIERVGYFNPIATGKDIPLSLKLERINYWMSTGAQASPRVQKLLKDFAKMQPTAVAA